MAHQKRALGTKVETIQARLQAIEATQEKNEFNFDDSALARAKQTVNGDARRNGCRDAVNAIKAAGGRAALAVLPDIGIKGNSHMMMMDRNNLQVAEVILKWLAENGAR